MEIFKIYYQLSKRIKLNYLKVIKKLHTLKFTRNKKPSQKTSPILEPRS